MQIFRAEWEKQRHLALAKAACLHLFVLSLLFSRDVFISHHLRFVNNVLYNRSRHTENIKVRVKRKLCI